MSAHLVFIFLQIKYGTHLPKLQSMKHYKSALNSGLPNNTLDYGEFTDRLIFVSVN